MVHDGRTATDSQLGGARASATVSSVEPEWREKLIHTVAVVALVYATYWICWRWWFTINPSPSGLAPSLLLLVAETWAYFSLAMFAMLTWKLTRRDPGPPPRNRTVDVFITCYDEPLDVVRRTAIGAKAIRYQHRTYILDDGKRDEMRAMAEEHGIGYIRRVGNANAKAGNLNHAIGVTSGEFILQLDADHVPLPRILDRMLGYFNDPKMAVVQSPQDFYNTDSFTHVVDDEGRSLWEENRIFYSLIQPGRDYWNASFFCGSCGILRRSAIEEIGGFATQTIIEDMETTIELHSRGYKSAYHRETLAYGLSPGSAGAYHVQRLRWAQGAMQVLRKLKPLTRPGLTLAQRINYFAGTACYFEGWQKSVFYLMPLFFLFTGILPIAASQEAFLSRLIPHLVLSILAFELLSRGTGYLLLSERFTMIRVYTYVIASLAIFTKKRLRFNVTPKGHAGVPRSTYMPQLALLALSIAAPIWASVAYHQGWVRYQVEGWGSMAFWLNGVWAAWNCYFALYVVRHTLRMRQERDDHRFVEQLPVEIRVEDGAAANIVPAMTADLNPSGIGFRATERIEPGTTISIQLPLGDQRVWTMGEVRHVEEQQTHLGPVFMHGVAFGRLPIDVRDAIERHCTQHSVQLWHARHRQSPDLMTRANEVIRNLRGARRRLAGLPAKVVITGGEGILPAPVPGMLILEELSGRGARLIGAAPIAPGTSITFSVPGAPVCAAGIVRHAQAIRTAVSVLFSMGVVLDAHCRNGRWGLRAPPVSSPPALVAGGELPLEDGALLQWEPGGTDGNEQVS